MLQKLNFCSILASLVLFCFPWVDIQCSGQSHATQSGLQVVYGGATPLRESAEPKPKKLQDRDKEDQETLGFAPLTASALALLLAAGYLAGRRLVRGKRDSELLSAALTALALLLLLLQWKSGFPVEARLAEMLAENREKISNLDPAKGGLLQSILAPVSTMVAGNIEVKMLPAFFYLLATLAIPPLVLLLSLLPKARASR